MNTVLISVQPQLPAGHTSSATLLVQAMDKERTPLMCLRVNRRELAWALQDDHPPLVHAELVPRDT